MRIFIKLQDDERRGLVKLSQIERREPRMQAAMIIREELQRRGLLQAPAVTDSDINIFDIEKWSREFTFDMNEWARGVMNILEKLR